MEIKACEKENRVEELIEGILKDIQLLASQHNMKMVTKEQAEAIINVIIEVLALENSINEKMFQETGLIIINSSSDTQNNI